MGTYLLFPTIEVEYLEPIMSRNIWNQQLQHHQFHYYQLNLRLQEFSLSEALTFSLSDTSSKWVVDEFQHWGS